MAPHFTIETVTYGSEDYQKMVALRNAVLRLPLGLTLSEGELERDQNMAHLAAISEEGGVIGTALLTQTPKGEAWVRQVCVAPEFHGLGIGARLMERAEDEARKQGFAEMVVLARDSAEPFYQRIGYLPESDYFIEQGIPHIQMRKVL